MWDCMQHTGCLTIHIHNLLTDCLYMLATCGILSCFAAISPCTTSMDHSAPRLTLMLVAGTKFACFAMSGCRKSLTELVQVAEHNMERNMTHLASKRKGQTNSSSKSSMQHQNPCMTGHQHAQQPKLQQPAAARTNKHHQASKQQPCDDLESPAIPGQAVQVCQVKLSKSCPLVPHGAQTRCYGRLLQNQNNLYLPPRMSQHGHHWQQLRLAL